jgi:hypothetical protein
VADFGAEERHLLSGKSDRNDDLAKRLGEPEATFGFGDLGEGAGLLGCEASNS